MRNGRLPLRLGFLLFFFFLHGTLLAQARRRSPTVLFAPTGNFQNPGARSFGLGGAFIALADDASAAELNPAGLTQLRRPEISLEYRRLEAAVPVSYPGGTAAGAFECLAPGFGSPGAACEGGGTTDEDSVSFVSLIVPGSANLTYALYRHELDRERFTLVRPAYSFPDGQVPGSIQSLDRRLVRTGLAVAWGPDPRWSVGVTVNLNSMTQDFRVMEYFTPFAASGEPGGDPFFLIGLRESRIESQKVGGTAGLLWRPVRPLSLGVSYSTRVRFEESDLRSFCAGISEERPFCGFLFPGFPDPENRYLLFQFDNVFTLPARAGASIAVRPASWLTLVAEGDLVAYSANDIETERFDPTTGDPIGVDRLTSDDVWELHAGAELAFPFARSGLVALRAGYWRDPDHSFRYDRCRAVAGATCEPDLLFTATNPPRGNLDHYTGGIGIAWAWGQLDVGYDWIEQDGIGTVAASLVIRAK